MQQSKRNSSIAASRVGICRRLRLISPGAGRGEAAGDGVLDGAHDEFGAELPGAAVTEFVKLGKMMAGVDVEQWQWQLGRAEGFLRQAQEADGILAAGKEQRGPFEFAGDLAHDVNGFGLEVL